MAALTAAALTAAALTAAALTACAMDNAFKYCCCFVEQTSAVLIKELTLCMALYTLEVRVEMGVSENFAG